MKRFLLAMVAVAMAGCTTAGSKKTTDNGYLVNYPISNARALSIIEGGINATFKDPYSVRDIRIERIIALNDYATEGESLTFSIFFWCNAKNSFGAYSGPTRYEIMC